MSNLSRAMKPWPSRAIADEGVIREANPRITWELGSEGWWIVVDGAPFDKHPSFNDAAKRALRNAVAVAETIDGNDPHRRRGRV